jgi:tetratricopeptide (TPR) repeat protein
LALALLLSLAWGCASPPARQQRSGVRTAPPRQQTVVEKPSAGSPQQEQPPVATRTVVPEYKQSDTPNPRQVASLRLTEQGRSLLENERPDDAIDMLERAVSLNPGNGQNYYYLAEAWLMKHEPKQANEYNRLAGLYLRGKPDWMRKYLEQKERIQKLLNR